MGHNEIIVHFKAHQKSTLDSPIHSLSSSSFFFLFPSLSSMDFLDEEARPRFLFQSRAQSASQIAADAEPKSLNKPLVFICVSISILIFSLAFFFYPDSEPITSLLMWVGLSLLVGPLAPSSITGGNIKVGRGVILENPVEDREEIAPVKKPKLRNYVNGGNNAQSWKSEEVGNEEVKGSEKEKKRSDFENVGKSERSEMGVQEEGEWTEEDFELLKKQMLKHPVGKPRRWEVIAEAFQGRHKVESVVKMAKSMAERKAGDDDSYARFLKSRKPLDKRVEEEIDGVVGEIKKEEIEKGWSSNEDIALLNALKAFPKEAPLRWEKIAAAVPGRSKNACMKRVTALKKNFRSSKGSNDA